MLGVEIGLCAILAIQAIGRSGDVDFLRAHVVVYLIEETELDVDLPWVVPIHLDNCLTAYC